MSRNDCVVAAGRSGDTARQRGRVWRARGRRRGATTDAPRTPDMIAYPSITNKRRLTPSAGATEATCAGGIGIGGGGEKGSRRDFPKKNGARND